MRLLHIVPSLEAQHGGPSRSVRALCGALAGAGQELRLLTTAPQAPARGEVKREGRLQIETYRRGWPGRLCHSRGLKAAVLQDSSPAIIHHHALWLRTLHYAHLGRAGQNMAKLVISPRGMMSAWAWHHHGFRKKLASLLIHPGALRAADGWHATSPEEESEIRALGFTQPVCVAPNGVEAPSPAEEADAIRYWQARCPATVSRPVALFYSRFHQKKRVLELIDLWLQRGPKDWLLLLVGIPQDYTPESIERYVLRMSGAGRIQACSGADAPAPYPVASLFVLPSHNENFGLVVAEAMAHGVPVIVTDTTPWRQISRNELGWCVSWPDFGDAIVQATSQGVERLRSRGGLARAWVVREFSWHNSAQRLARFYAELGAEA
jgi:glycosyltransferase involved in cell wall biosynthesis